MVANANGYVGSKEKQIVKSRLKDTAIGWNVATQDKEVLPRVVLMTRLQVSVGWPFTGGETLICVSLSEIRIAMPPSWEEFKIRSIVTTL